MDWTSIVQNDSTRGDKMKSSWKLDGQLETFLKMQGNGKDIPSDFEPVDTDLSRFPTNFGIQQNLEEFLQFLNFCKESNLSNYILEIGFGYYGTSHAILRHYFNKVLSIDNQVERMRNFYFRAYEFFGDEFFKEKKSFFIGGNSDSARTFEKTYKLLCDEGTTKFQELDVLFIDGSHAYENVLMDFLVYENLVKVGGYIAFHDINNPMNDSGVSKFLNLMTDTNYFNGRFKFCKEFVASRFLGIGVYEKCM